MGASMEGGGGKCRRSILPPGNTFLLLVLCVDLFCNVFLLMGDSIILSASPTPQRKNQNLQEENHPLKKFQPPFENPNHYKKNLNPCT